MQTILLTVALMGVMMLVMAVGVIFKRPPLKGSCGGPGGMDCLCEELGTPNACETPEESPSDSVGRSVDDGVVLYD